MDAIPAAALIQIPIEVPAISFGSSSHRALETHAIELLKFHVIRHLGDALDKIRKSEYARPVRIEAALRDRRTLWIGYIRGLKRAKTVLEKGG